VRRIIVLLSALLAFGGQAPAPAPAPLLHLVYQFGYNTKASDSGTGTGTTTVDIVGPAADGGVRISGTDHWWNTPRPRATNTCEVYPNGNVKCGEPPYAISPIQLTLFPLLGRDFFKALGPDGKEHWSHTFTFYAAIIPGASGSLGHPNTWKCTYEFTGKGPIAKSEPPLILIEGTGRLAQQSGNFLKANSKERIAYDPAHKVPALVSDVRTYIPQSSVYSNALVDLKLIRIKHGS
jgi:hypothetical protein